MDQPGKKMADFEMFALQAPGNSSHLDLLDRQAFHWFDESCVIALFQSRAPGNP
jgi:hypothetical protein